MTTAAPEAPTTAFKRRWPRFAGPFETGGSTHKDILRAWIFASSFVALWGVVLFGPAAFRLIAVSIAAAIGAEFLAAAVRGKAVVEGISHAALSGLLLALTLPATAAWYIAVCGAVVAILIGKTVFGGYGHYLWHPVLVGRVAVQLLFLNSLTLGSANPTWPILAPGKPLIGDVHSTRTLDPAGYGGWSSLPPSGPTDAVLMPRPVQSLRRFADGELKPDGELAYEALLRDVLPPWKDTITGRVPGAIGETCTLALIVAGFYLIYRGYLRWQLPVTILAGAALAAAVFPIESGEQGAYDWFPIFAQENGRAVGLAYVLYHLTSGELMLGAFLLAGDMVATPMRARGQALFGAGVGLLTIFMRLYGVLECECYWSILIMNSLVRTIDTRTRRPVLGLAVPNE